MSDALLLRQFKKCPCQLIADLLTNFAAGLLLAPKWGVTQRLGTESAVLGREKANYSKPMCSLHAKVGDDEARGA
jgi:hypothetical protein